MRIAALALAVVVIGSLIANGLRLMDEQERARGWETHTYEVLLVSKDFTNAVDEIDASERGYLLSGSPADLSRMNAELVRAPALLDRLARLTRDNPRQIPRIARLRGATDRYLALTRESVATASPRARFNTALGRSTKTERSSGVVQAELHDFVAEEERLLVKRSASTQVDTDATRTALYELSLAGILLLIAAAVAVALAAKTFATARVAAVERKAENDLEHARDFLLAVIDGASDSIYAKDTEGRFLLANLATARIYNTDRERMIGQTDFDLLPREVAAARQISDRRIIEAGRDLVVEEQLLLNGGLRTFQSSKAPWRREGVIVGLVGVAQDVTDRKAAETALRDLNEQLEARVDARTREIEKAETQIRQMQKIESLGQLTGGIAHDFNNMLAIVIGSLDIAARRLDEDPAKARSFIESAQEGATRAATLTARLLAFSRQQPLTPESLDANKLVSGMSELLRRTIGERIKVETVLAGGLWRTMADPGEVENALLNLCVNARDAMAEGGRLTVETANAHLDDAYAVEHPGVAPGQYVLICVSDTGSGMTPDVVERAFEPFYTTKGVGKGTGLGLSQVYGFIKQSGGHLKIYSEVGHGTTVKIYLPRWFGVDATREVPIRQTVTVRGAPTEIILVVEDEPGVRNLSVDALRELGYTVIHADSPLDALQMIEKHPSIHLLFTDIIMPEMNGRQLADRAVAKRPELKVLYTTGYTRNAIVHNGVLDPGLAFLPKPFTIDQLATKVRLALDS